MTLNKRDFLVGSVGAASLAATASATASQRSPLAEASQRLQRHPDLAQGYSAERFEAYVGETFQAGDASLVLAGVDRLALDGPSEQFVLRFEAPAGTAPLNGLQALRHTGSGQSLALQLEAQAEQAYSAAFNLLR